MRDIRILIVEDDKAVKNLIELTLDTAGYEHACAKNGQDALTQTVSYSPHVILLDLGLPDTDGVKVIEKIRTWNKTPIIVVSARSDEWDKIEALDAGADDYITKPFSTEELLARLRVALRRIQYGDQNTEVASVFVNGGLKINYGAGCVFIDEEQVHLTPIEYKLLCVLSQNVGRVLTHNNILKMVWTNALPEDVPSLRVFMATLRKKIEKDPKSPKYIQTHIGVGYRMLRISDE